MAPEGWFEYSLAELCKKPVSYGIVQTGENIPDGIPCVRVVDLAKRTLCTRSMITTCQEINRSYKKTILEQGELMMALRGEIGLVRLVDETIEGANITRGIARLSPRDEIINSDYLLWAMRSGKVRKDLLAKAGGSALQEISLASLRKLLLLLPPLPEQRKIAKILQTWDRAIATTEKLINASKQQKKALMQQLLTGKKRFAGFEGEWESVRLGDVFNERLDTGYNELPLLSITSEAGVISRDGVGRKDTSNTDKQKYKRICPGDIGYNTMRMWQGVSGLSSLEGIVSPAYTVVVPTSEISPEYTSYLFKLPALVNIFTRNSQGLVSDTWNLKFKHFAKIKWTFPSLNEQIKISTALLSADNELGVLQTKLIHLKGEKNALMQQLLTGKRRVRTDD